MTSILDFLVSIGIIGQNRREEIQQQLLNPSTESIPNINQTKTFQHLNLLGRQKYFPKNSFNYKLINLMMKKKTNLCLAVDNFNKEQILKVSFKFKCKGVGSNSYKITRGFFLFRISKIWVGSRRFF